MIYLLLQLHGGEVLDIKIMAKKLNIIELAARKADLIAEFNAYLEQEGADPYADSVGYRQSALWLTEAECTDIIDEVRTTLVSRLTNKPSPERRPYLMSAILFPTEPRAPRAAGGRSRSNDSGAGGARGKKGRGRPQ